MCDTICVVGSDGVLFAKNSDRDANETQLLEWHPRTDTSRAILISRPFQMWGAEMGTNEDGVTIGNEAVFTKTRVPRRGLTGMELLRHGLEKGRAAAEVLEVITRLLQERGQGGSCGYEDPSFRYFSSFIVADPTEAFVLETCDREWATEQIRGVRSISNVLTIESFAKKHSDRIKTAVACGRARRAFTETSATGANPAELMAILRSHGGYRWPHYHPVSGTLCAPCMHGGGIVASSVTTASMISLLERSRQRHWVTGTSAPCLSIYKPAAVGDPVAVGDLWRRHERLHRAVLKNPERLAVFLDERDEIEARWLADPPESRAAFQGADGLLARWTEQVERTEAAEVRPFWARRYWAKRSENGYPKPARA